LMTSEPLPFSLRKSRVRLRIRTGPRPSLPEICSSFNRSCCRMGSLCARRHCCSACNGPHPRGFSAE
jgi:hypothetical protein